MQMIQLLMSLLVVVLSAAAGQSHQDVQSVPNKVVDIGGHSQAPEITVTIDWLFSSQEGSRSTVVPLSDTVTLTTICPTKCSVVTLSTSVRYETLFPSLIYWA